MSPRLDLAPLGLTLALVTAPLTAHEVPEAEHAEGHHALEDGGHSHDRARRAMESGEILHLAEILERIRPHAPGRILHTELEHEHGQWVYELKLLDPQGRLYALDVDARDGAILRRWEGR